MKTQLARIFTHLLDRAAKLRAQFCPKFSICSAIAFSQEDKSLLEQIQSGTGWDNLDFVIDGSEYKAVFSMKDDNVSNSNLIQVHRCTSYI